MGSWIGRLSGEREIEIVVPVVVDEHDPLIGELRRPPPELCAAAVSQIALSDVELQRRVLPCADDEVEYAVSIDVASRDAARRTVIDLDPTGGGDVSVVARPVVPVELVVPRPGVGVEQVVVTVVVEIGEDRGVGFLAEPAEKTVVGDAGLGAALAKRAASLIDEEQVRPVFVASEDVSDVDIGSSVAGRVRPLHTVATVVPKREEPCRRRHVGEPERPVGEHW